MSKSLESVMAKRWGGSFVFVSPNPNIAGACAAQRILKNFAADLKGYGACSEIPKFVAHSR